MQLKSFYPVLFTDDVAASSAFYTTHFGFRETFRSDWYMSLIHGENKAYQLAVMQRTHDSIPEGFREQRSSLLLNFEVPDATSEYERLQAAAYASSNRFAMRNGASAILSPSIPAAC